MIYLIPNILSEEECKFLVTQFDLEKSNTKSVDIIAITPNTFGFRPSDEFNIYLDKLKPKVLETLNTIDLIDTNTYVREYKNKSFLAKHKDRTDINITMSICLESTINKKWPLWAEIDNKNVNFNTNVGDCIILTDSDKIIHWRDELICNENERVLQFFLHWKKTNYSKKQNKTLI
jgi:hypothetical protein